MAKRIDANAEFPEAALDEVVSWEQSSLLPATYRMQRINPDDLAGRKGLTVYAKMRVDEQVKAVMQFKRDAITARGWTFKYDKASKLSREEQVRRTRVFEHAIENMSGAFEDALNAISTGRDFGFSLTEKVYSEMQVDGKTYVGIGMLLTRDPTSFEFYTDEYGMLIECRQVINGKQQVMDLRKFVHYVHSPEFDRYFGRSDLREAYRAWYAKSRLHDMWLLYMERFGSGFMRVKRMENSTVQPGTQAFNDLQALVRNSRGALGVVLPPGVELDIEYPQATDGFESAIVYQDLAIAKALLVPNLLGISNTGETGAYAQSQTQLEAFFWTLNADATRLEACLNEQLFTDLGDQNFGDGEYPRFCFKPASLEHVKWVIDTWKGLVDSKAVVTTEKDEEYLRSLLEMPEREEGDEAILDPLAVKQMEAETAANNAAAAANSGQQQAAQAANDSRYAAMRDTLSRIEAMLFHLPGQHDQSTHGNNRGGGNERESKVPHEQIVKALEQYTGAQYRHINRYMRGVKGIPGTGQIRKQIEALKAAFNTNEFTEEIKPGSTIYRGMYFDHYFPAQLAEADKFASLKQGDVIGDKAFMSTSINATVARGFANLGMSDDGPDDGTTRVMLYIKSFTSLTAVRGDSFEYERILPPKTAYRVDSVKRIDGINGRTLHINATVVRASTKFSADDEPTDDEIIWLSFDGAEPPDAKVNHSRATERVDFTVIAKKMDDLSVEAANALSNGIAKAVQRSLPDERINELLGEHRDELDGFMLDGNDVGRLKKSLLAVLSEAASFGSREANGELRRTGGEKFARATFAALQDSMAEYLGSRAFRAAGDLSDATRSIIMQELQNALKYGYTTEQAKANIWDRLVSKGFTSRGAVRMVESEPKVTALLDEMWVEDEGEALARIGTIVRTNMFDALNEARYAEFDKARESGFIVAYEYSAVMDDRTTEICRELDGAVYAADNPLWNRYRPLNHYNCRSVLVPIFATDKWSGEESPPPTVEPQEGFG